MGKLTEQALYNFLRENPRSTLFTQYADILLGKDQVEQAYMLCVQGVKAHPKFATGWLVLGKAALRQDEKIFAKKCWMNALAADKMCLQAAELLLTTGSLDLKIKEAYTAANAILNVDPDHLVARTTMTMIQERHKTTDKNELPDSAKPARDKTSSEKNNSSDISGSREEETEDSLENEYDLYGTDTKNISDLLKTIEQVKFHRNARTRSSIPDNSHKAKAEEQQNSTQPENGTQGSIGTVGYGYDEESSEGFSESRFDGEDGLPARMATLTFVRILKSQGLYENALVVLDRITPTDSNQDQIEQERRELNHLLETNEE